MRILLLLLSGSLLLVQLAAGQNYSCRDDQGKLHFTDNLTNLPPECLTKAKKLEPRPTENLNFVPAAPPPPVSRSEIDQQVREVEQQQAQKQRLAEQMERRAQGLHDQYQQALRSKRQALRSWNYSSRETIKQADQEIQQAREGKQQLLDELPRASIDSDKKQQIRTILSQIDDQ